MNLKKFTKSYRSDYGQCSQSCKGGLKHRTRIHSCTNEKQVDSCGCGSEGFYSNWFEVFILLNKKLMLCITGSQAF